MKRLSQKEAEDPKTNWTEKVKTFSRFQGGKLDGFFDTSAGFTYADKVRFSPICISQDALTVHRLINLP